MSLIQLAYVQKAEAIYTPEWNVPISGGPAWINSDLYTIEAKPVGQPGTQVLEGPMLQTLLEDRFKLKIRRETRDVPVYFLVPAGPKLEKVEEGSCVPFDSRAGFTRRDRQRVCGALRIGRNGRGIHWDFDSVTVTEFARTLHLDRPVVDRTGIAGLYRFHLEFALDRTTAQFLPGPENGRGWQESTGGLLPVDDPTAGPFIRTAIEEQLGLRLEPTRGPSDFLIIDSIARPTEN